MRGRPPTPPVAASQTSPIYTLGGHGLVNIDAGPQQDPKRPGRAELAEKNQGQDASADVESVEIHGQYADTTSSLTFIQRARERFISVQIDDTSVDFEGTAKSPNNASDKALLGQKADERGPVDASLSCPLPAPADGHDLLDLYFDVCIATYKPLHKPTLCGWYQHTMEHRGLQDRAKLSVLHSIFAIATFHRQKSRGFSDDASSLRESDASFKEAARLTSSPIDVPRLEDVQAQLLQVFYLLMTSRMNRAWYVFGNVFQMVSALGLHRRHQLGRSSILASDYVLRECRKRMFWTAYILDKYLGVVMGRPGHFHDEDIDQEYPDCVNDSDMASFGPMRCRSPDDCLLDAFVANIKLAQIVGKISRQSYPIAPLDRSSRTKATKQLWHEVEDWYAALPPFLSTVRPSTLVRSFRRQSIALNLAKCHALMHLHRPYLLTSAEELSDKMPRQSAGEAFASDCIVKCITAAREALRVVDGMAREGPLFHAFWWTHYVTFCALAVVYVWEIRHQSKGIDTSDSSALLELAALCHGHLAQATATNSPSRRYSVILDELKTEANSIPEAFNRQSAVTRGCVGGDFEASANGPAMESTSCTGNEIRLASAEEETEVAGVPFEDWQISDWLDLDAMAFDPMSNFGPEMQWMG